MVLIHHWKYERFPPILHTLFSVCFDRGNDYFAWVRQQGIITLRRVAIFFDICTIWRGYYLLFIIYFSKMSGGKYDHWNIAQVHRPQSEPLR